MKLKGLILATLMLVPLLLSAEQWSTPEPLSQFNTSPPTRDLELWLSADGKTAYFASNRYGDNDGIYEIDILTSQLIDGSWSIPVQVPYPISFYHAWDGHPSLTLDGRYMYFFSARYEGFRLGLTDIYVSENIDGIWQPEVNLGYFINSEHYDNDPFITPDGQTLYFASDRHGGYGKKDLYMARKIDGVWQPPENLGPTINSNQDDDHPSLSYTGQYLFFASVRKPETLGYWTSDIYRSEKVGGVWQKPINLGIAVNTELDDTPGIFNDCTNVLIFNSITSTIYNDWEIFTSKWLDNPNPNPCSKLIIPEGEWRVRVTLLESTGALKSDLFIDAPLAIERPLIKNSLKHIGSVVETPFLSGEELVFHIEINGESQGLGKYSHYSNSEFAQVERTDPLRYIVGFEEMPADQADWDYNDVVLLVELIGKEVNIHEKNNYLKEKQTVVKTVKGEDTELTVIVHNGPAAHAGATIRGNGLNDTTYAILTEGDPALYDSEFIGAPFASKDALLKLELENGQTSLLNGELIDLQINEFTVKQADRKSTRLNSSHRV